MFLVESENKDSNTDIVVFGRDKDGVKSVKRISNFRPYFYVLETEEVPVDFRITGVEKGYTSILGEPVKKVYARKSSDIADLREIFKKTFEADILFAQRYIIDEIEIEPYPLRILYFDIELNTDKELPDMADANQEITCISLLDSFTDKELVLMYKSPNYSGELKESDSLKIFNSEKDMLEAFMGFFVKYDPDIISGWNVDKFDLVYTIRRMARLGIEYNKLSPLGRVSINEKYEEVTIKGRIVLDMMRAYEQYRKMSNQRQAESYSLEYTSTNVVGRGKMKHKETFSEMWDKFPEKLAEYNALDVRLVKEINDKLDIITFFNSIRCKACAQLKQIYFASMLIDGLLLRTCKGEIVFPSRPIKTGDEEKFSGAFVTKPVPGVYENVVVFDVKGMYLAIIKSFNIGYETFNPKGEIQITKEIGFNKGLGIIPKILFNLQIERDMYKKKMKFAYANGNEAEGLVNHYKQYSVKVLMNSMFGYLGFPNSRLYKKEVANAITTMGRELSNWINDFITKQGYKVVYSDTDSCYFVSNKSTIFDIIGDSKKLLDAVNNSFEEVVKSHGGETCYIEMEFEKVYKSLIFVSKRNEEGGAKKKYAVIPYWVNGKIVKDKLEYTGFDAVRSDSPRIAREIQETVLDMILRKRKREDVDKYLKTMYEDILSGKISEEKVASPKRIKESLTSYKTAGPIVNGALYSNKYLGTRFSKGDKPKFMYIRAVPPGYPNTDVITFEDKLPEGFIPDWDKIMERIFKMKLEDIYRVKGWEWDWGNIKEVKQQTLGF